MNTPKITQQMTTLRFIERDESYIEENSYEAYLELTQIDRHGDILKEGTNSDGELLVFDQKMWLESDDEENWMVCMDLPATFVPATEVLVTRTGPYDLATAKNVAMDMSIFFSCNQPLGQFEFDKSAAKFFYERLPTPEQQAHKLSLVKS